MLNKCNYTCDICGAEYAGHGTGAVTVTSWSGIEITRDLCPECHRRTVEWLQAQIDQHQHGGEKQ